MQHHFSCLQIQLNFSCVLWTLSTSLPRKRDGLHQRDTLHIFGPFSRLSIHMVSVLKYAGTRKMIAVRFLFPRIYACFGQYFICVSDAKISLMCRPMYSPVLSKRARRETRTIGDTDYQASIPHSNSTLTAYLDLDTLSVQSIDDSPTPLADDVLCVFSSSAFRAALIAHLCPS